MILLTTGTQLPFERMVMALDEIAPHLALPVFGQIGKSAYRPQHFEWVSTIDPVEFDAKFRSARLIVSHAGIGTVLTAQRLGKPIILFPREARYGEHRNDHQLATCAQLSGRPGIAVARNKKELETAIHTTENLSPAIPIDRRKAFTDNLSEAIAYLVSH